MSSHVQTVQVEDITSKWALAQRMSGHAKAPEEALRALFTGVMQEIEAFAKIKFDVPMKDRVWDRVSGDKLKTLKEVFILEFCNQILGDFNEEEATTILEEHRRTGVVKGWNAGRLQVAVQLFRSSVIEAVAEKTKSMGEEWIPEIVHAVESEGIELLGEKSDEKK